MFATGGESSLHAKHVLAKVRPNLLIHCSNCALTVHIHLKTFNSYYQHKRPTLNVVHCKGKVVCFLLGNSPASEFYILRTYPPMKMEQSVPKRRHIK